MATTPTPSLLMQFVPIILLTFALLLVVLPLQTHAAPVTFTKCDGLQGIEVKSVDISPYTPMLGEQARFNITFAKGYRILSDYSLNMNSSRAMYPNEAPVDDYTQQLCTLTETRDCDNAPIAYWVSFTRVFHKPGILNSKLRIVFSDIVLTCINFSVFVTMF